MKKEKDTSFGVNSACRTLRLESCRSWTQRKCLLTANAREGVMAHESSFLSWGLAVSRLMGSGDSFYGIGTPTC